MNDTTILVIEDDKTIQNFMKISLRTRGYSYILADNGLSGISLFYANHPDLILLDLGLPDIDGMEVLKQIRQQSNTPIIVVSARGQEREKISALDQGADDYVTKPFRPLELIARVKAQLRRYKRYSSPGTEDDVITVSGLVLDREKHGCWLNEKPISLTPIEFSILWYLCKNKGKVVSSEELFRVVWKEKYFTSSNNTVMVHIRHIREKMKDSAENPKYIKNVWGVGYKVEE